MKGNGIITSLSQKQNCVVNDSPFLPRASSPRSSPPHFLMAQKISSLENPFYFFKTL